MLYAVQVTIPATTPSSAPFSMKVDVAERMLSGFYVVTDTITFNTVGIRLLVGSTRMIPSPILPNPHNWIYPTGGRILILEDDLPLGESPYSVTIESFNTTGANVILMLLLRIVNLTETQLLEREVEALNKIVEQLSLMP